ncbi:hypothetical protein GLOIN_2v1785497 [Rhizophagus irregularis DAOM 181602=DAOM 197198]|nr:hypothetical protein GLOIN_2v1785497 [Rhizophagus irregularis DAOM 181602=DAOM 197198]
MCFAYNLSFVAYNYSFLSFLLLKIAKPQLIDSIYPIGLYSPSAITPYIHVLVYHISEFMEIHKQWGVKAFSCAPVEKKNHQQVTYFFRQSFKGGGSKHKSVIKEILEYESRSLFYLFDDVVTSTPKPKKLNIF